MSETFILHSLSPHELRKLISEETKKAIYGALENQKKSPVYVTPDEAAKILGIKKSTLYDKTHKNLIPFHKSGKLLRFKVDECKTSA